MGGKKILQTFGNIFGALCQRGSDGNDNFVVVDWVFTVIGLSVLLKVSVYNCESIASSDVGSQTTPLTVGMKTCAYWSLF